MLFGGKILPLTDKISKISFYLWNVKHTRLELGSSSNLHIPIIGEAWSLTSPTKLFSSSGSFLSAFCLIAFYRAFPFFPSSRGYTTAYFAPLRESIVLNMFCTYRQKWRHVFVACFVDRNRKSRRPKLLIINFLKGFSYALFSDMAIWA